MQTHFFMQSPKANQMQLSIKPRTASHPLRDKRSIIDTSPRPVNVSMTTPRLHNDNKSNMKQKPGHSRFRSEISEYRGIKCNPAGSWPLSIRKQTPFKEINTDETRQFRCCFEYIPRFVPTPNFAIRV